MSDLPPLPSGFKLDSQSDTPPLPPGFKLDSTPAAPTAPQPTVGQTNASGYHAAGRGYAPGPAPTTEPGIGYEAETLYQMASTPEGQKSALEKVYGADKVGQDDKGLFVHTPNGVARPGQGDRGARDAGFLASQAAPALGAVAGGMAGGAIGAPGGPAFAVGGAMSGAAVGGAAGQGFNDMLLSLAGVHQGMTPRQEAGNMATTGAMSAVGEGAGRAIGAAVPLAKRAYQGAVGQEGIVRKGIKFLGKSDTEDPDKWDQVRHLAEKGVHVPPETWAPGSSLLPIIRSWAKIFGYDPVGKAAKPYYESEGGKILKTLGVSEEESKNLTSQTAAVSQKEVGEAMIKRSREIMAQEDANLAAHLKAARDHVNQYGSEAIAAHQDAITSMEAAADKNRAAANVIIDQGWSKVKAIQNKLAKVSKLGGGTGALARQVSESIWNLRKAVVARASKLYDAADAAAGDTLIDVSNARGVAQDFVENLPEDLKNNHPTLIKALAKMEDGHMTFGQARGLRTLLRDLPNWSRLEPSFREGQFKRLAREVDDAINSTENAPAARRAAKLLDKADDFYRENMAKFSHETFQRIVDDTKNGIAPNPEVVADEVFSKGRNDELVTSLKKVMGAQAWNGVVAADIKSVMDGSKGLVPGTIDTKAFAKQMLDRVRSGVIDYYPPDIAATLRQHAARLDALEGRLDVKVLPNDSFKDVVQNMLDAKERATALSKINPVKTLSEELDRINKEFAEKQTLLKQNRARDPLSFLNDEHNTELVYQAAHRILQSPDLVRFAVKTFGDQSHEIALLRQTAAKQYLMRDMDKTSKLFGDIKELPPETQKLLFPNGTDKQLIQLGKDMLALFPPEGDWAVSMSGINLVLHPWTIVHGAGRALLKTVPGFISRPTVGAALGVVSKYVTHPDVLLWITKSANGGPAAQRVARETIMRWADVGGNIGAASGASLGTTIGKPGRQQNAAPVQDWRTTYQQKYGAQANPAAVSGQLGLQ